MREKEVKKEVWEGKTKERDGGDKEGLKEKDGRK